MALAHLGLQPGLGLDDAEFHAQTLVPLESEQRSVFKQLLDAAGYASQA